MLQGLSKYRGVLIAILVPYLWLAAVRIVSLDEGGEAAADTYYHVAMGDLFPEGCVAKTFPWMTMSVWKDRFYDKELLFHGALSALRGVGRALGFSSEAPFHFPALALNLALISIFAFLARAMNIPRVYFFTAILVVMCPFFTQRLLMLRPHLLSMIIMLIFCWHLTRARKSWPAFVFGFFTAYAYSNPHLILVPAVVFAALTFRRNRRMAALIPLATLGGIVAGLTLHPQFPNTFELWKIQCVDVIRQAVLRESPVYLGTELYGPAPAWYAQNAAFFILLACNLLYLRRARFRDLPFDTSFFLVLQVLAAVGVLFSKRVFEYGWPFAVIAAGLVFRDLSQAGFFGRFAARIRARALIGAHIALAAGFCIFGVYMLRWVWPYQTRELRDFPAWAARNLPAGTLIANPNWSDFPMLFYGSPQYRYSLGIEPMFGYNAMPEQVAKLEAFRTGRTMLAPAELRSLTKARYAFVGMRAWKLAYDMHRSGYYFVYQNEYEGWLFDLEHGQSKR